MLIDLSHTLQPDMPTFKTKSGTLPPPQISPWMSHAQAAASGNYEDCSCEITQMQFITSCGTYLDSPYHFHPERATIDQLRLDQLVLPGIVVDCRGLQAYDSIEPHVLEGVDIAGKAVLFHTGWSQYWGQPEYHHYPYLTGATADALVKGGAKLAGVDYIAADDARNPRRPVHVTLLGHDILIVENLTNLAVLPTSGFTFHAVPIKVQGAAAFPIRAYAVLGV